MSGFIVSLTVLSVMFSVIGSAAVLFAKGQHSILLVCFAAQRRASPS